MKKEVMLRAWRIFRKFNNLSFAKCLKRSWAIQKENVDFSTIKLKSFFNSRLSTFNRISTENKAMLNSTREHFKMLNSKKGKSILRLPDNNDSKEMLVNGELVLNDIIRNRKQEKGKYIEPKKQKEKFRNRIFNYENSVKVNIQDYV